MNLSNLENALIHCEKVLISPFSNLSKDGGGWASRKLFKNLQFTAQIIRPDHFFKKIAWAILSWMLTPFLHPLFARYAPICNALLLKKSDALFLNHSQTFSLTLFHKKTILVCHDLQFHRSSNIWLRWSERFLIGRAAYIVVLSMRDAEILNCEYEIDFGKIYCAFSRLTDELESYCVGPICSLRNVVFLGSLDRKENYDAMLWFVSNVASQIPDLKISIIGKCDECNKIKYRNLSYVNYVDDLSVALMNYDACIAPMQSAAGVKIKTIDYIKLKKIVLGTTSAFSGFLYHPDFYVTDDPADWVRLINSPPVFSYISASEGYSSAENN